MTIIWCMVLRHQVCEGHNFLSFWIVLPFYPQNNLKNQNFEKILKMPGDIIILHMCTINDNHMMYGSWHIKHDGHNFLSFWFIFCTFIPLTTQKIKILKKWKKTPEDITTLHMCTLNENHMMYGSWDMERDRHNFCHFGLFFALLHP